MLYDFVNGQTSVVLRLKLRNATSSSGAGLTGLTGASTGLSISTICDTEATATTYTAAASHIGTIASLGTFAAPAASSCRFAEVDATNHPGLYELQLADARFAVAGAKSLTITLSGVTNLAECDVVIPLRSINPYSATAFVTSVPTVVNLTNAPTAGDLTATMKTSVTTAVPTAAAITTAVAAAILATPANLLVTDSSGRVLLTPTQALAAARALDSVADTSLTLNDALHCAIAAAAGQETVVSTAYTVKTPHTATALRTFTLDSATAPTQRT